MKKAITFILLFIILLSAVGCVDYEKDSSAEESNSISGGTEKEEISTDVSQNKADPETTQPTNGTETNPPDQTNSTTVTEPSSPSGTQTTPSEVPSFVTGNDGVDLPINPF